MEKKQKDTLKIVAKITFAWPFMFAGLLLYAVSVIVYMLSCVLIGEPAMGYERLKSTFDE